MTGPERRWHWVPKLCDKTPHCAWSRSYPQWTIPIPEMHLASSDPFVSVPCWNLNICETYYLSTFARSHGPGHNSWWMFDFRRKSIIRNSFVNIFEVMIDIFSDNFEIKFVREVDFFSPSFQWFEVATFKFWPASPKEHGLVSYEPSSRVSW